MSARDPPNLKRWVEWGVKKAGKLIEESFELTAKNVSGDTTTDGRRKGVPNSWSGNSEAARTDTDN